MPQGIFISYRRDDTSGFAGRLFDRLAESFSRDQLFMDVESIEPGANFADVLSQRIGDSEVLLVLIGPRWLAPAVPERGSRLNDPADFVRIEIEAALACNVRVIPVLIDGARMPAVTELPVSIGGLALRQTVDISHRGFEADASQLLQTLSRIVKPRERNATDTLALPAKPSIVVLPFQNMSGDPEQEYFTDGMTEEITTALARIAWLFVIARNSAFTYKGRAVDIKQIGRDLGVRYALEGSVRRAGNRMRITGQLLDAETGAHLWADRFDGALEDVFDLQDQVTASVVAAIAPKLEQAEVARAKRKPTESLDAYDYSLRGIENLYLLTKESVDEALQLFHKAIELDSNFAAAYGFAAYCYSQRKGNSWVTDRARDISEASRLGRRAVALGKDDAGALARAAHALAYVVEDLDAGALFVDRALALNPNLAFAWYVSGWVRVWIGEPDVSIQHFARFMRMSPVDPLVTRMHNGTAFAHVLAGRYDTAAVHAEQSLNENPNSPQALRMAAVSYALAGRVEQAQKTMVRLRQIDPTLRISNLRDHHPLRRPEDAARLAEGMRIAGLPE